MISSFSISPMLQTWYNGKKLQHIGIVKHCLHSGWIVAKLANAVFGDARFPLTSFNTDTSTANASHNWKRIYAIVYENKLPLKLSDAIIQQIVTNKDEKQMLEALIQLYEIDTHIPYPRKTITSIVPQKLDKQPPYILFQQNNTLLNAPQTQAINTTSLSYPTNVPHFCRASYANARKLIDHLSTICVESIQQIPETRDYIEMLDPRADYCFPFPQLLLKLPVKYCVQVCKYLCEHINGAIVTACICADYQLFYDFSTVVLHSVIALNQVSGNANELFDIVTAHLCQIIESLRKISDDVVYLVFNNIILAKVFPELPLVNFSIVHFLRICMACTQTLSTQLFHQLIQLCLSNLKRHQPGVSENRLRFEVLIAFTILARRSGRFKEYISRGCVKYALSGELLSDPEKYVALDLMVRCVDLNPSLVTYIKFHFFRILSVILNKPNYVIESDASNMLDFEDQMLTISVEHSRPGEQAKPSFDFVFLFNNLHRLTYQQVLFINTIIHKMMQADVGSTQIEQVAKGLDYQLIKNEMLPPSHFYIGLVSSLSRYMVEINEISEILQQYLLEKPPKESEERFKAIMQEKPYIHNLLQYTCRFLLQCTPYFVDSVFSLLDGNYYYYKYVQSALDRRYVDKSHFIAFGEILSQHTSNIDNNSEIAKTNSYDESIQIPGLPDNTMSNPQILVVSENTRVDYVDTNTPLPVSIYKAIFKMRPDIKLTSLIPLLTFVAAASDLTASSSYLLFKLCAVDVSTSAYVYACLSDNLYAAILSETPYFSDSAIDLLQMLLINVENHITINAIRDDVRDSLQTLLECCFGFASARSPVDNGSNRSAQQYKTIKLLHQLFQEQYGRQALSAVFEKTDYETYGNEGLERLIYEVSGEM